MIGTVCAAPVRRICRYWAVTLLTFVPGAAPAAAGTRNRDIIADTAIMLPRNSKPISKNQKSASGKREMLFVIICREYAAVFSDGIRHRPPQRRFLAIEISARSRSGSFHVVYSICTPFRATWEPDVRIMG